MTTRDIAPMLGPGGPGMPEGVRVVELADELGRDVATPKEALAIFDGNS